MRKQKNTSWKWCRLYFVMPTHFIPGHIGRIGCNVCNFLQIGVLHFGVNNVRRKKCLKTPSHSDFKLALWRNQDRAEALLRVLIAALRAEIDALIARYAWVWTRSWVLFFVWALRDTSGRYMVDCTRAIFSQTVRTAAAYFAISLLRPSGEKKQTFSVVSLQLTVQLPCRNVFSSFILPLRACQKRSFDDVSTVGAGAERGVKSRQANRSPQSLRSTKIRAWLP